MDDERLGYLTGKVEALESSVGEMKEQNEKVLNKIDKLEADLSIYRAIWLVLRAGLVGILAMVGLNWDSFLKFFAKWGS